MERPDLTQKDLDEVDRLLSLANACKCRGLSFKEQAIRTSSLCRAADILGVAPEPTEDEESTDTGPAAVTVKPGVEAEFGE